MKAFYILATGCNSRHLTDISVFNLQRDATKALQSLPVETAYKLTRHVESDKYASDVEITTICELIQ